MVKKYCISMLCILSMATQIKAGSAIEELNKDFSDFFYAAIKMYDIQKKCLDEDKNANPQVIEGEINKTLESLIKKADTIQKENPKDKIIKRYIKNIITLTTQEKNKPILFLGTQILGLFITTERTVQKLISGDLSADAPLYYQVAKKIVDKLKKIKPINKNSITQKIIALSKEYANIFPEKTSEQNYYDMKEFLASVLIGGNSHNDIQNLDQKTKERLKEHFKKENNLVLSIIKKYTDCCSLTDEEKVEIQEKLNKKYEKALKAINTKYNFPQNWAKSAINNADIRTAPGVPKEFDFIRRTKEKCTLKISQAIIKKAIADKKSEIEKLEKGVKAGEMLYKDFDYLG